MREEVFPAVPADTKPADRAHLPCVGDETKRGFAASADLAEVIPLAQDTVHPQVVQPVSYTHLTLPASSYV